MRRESRLSGEGRRRPHAAIRKRPRIPFPGSAAFIHFLFFFAFALAYEASYIASRRSVMARAVNFSR